MPPPPCNPIPLDDRFVRKQEGVEYEEDPLSGKCISLLPPNPTSTLSQVHSVETAFEKQVDATNAARTELSKWRGSYNGNSEVYTRLFLANASLARLKAVLARDDIPADVRHSLLFVQEHYKDEVPILKFEEGNTGFEQSLATVAEAIMTHHKCSHFSHEVPPLAHYCEEYCVNTNEDYVPLECMTRGPDLTKRPRPVSEWPESATGPRAEPPVSRVLQEAIKAHHMKWRPDGYNPETDTVTKTPNPYISMFTDDGESRAEDMEDDE